MSWIYRFFNQPSVKTLWRAYRYLRPYWRLTAGAYLTLLLVNAFTVAIPQFIRWIVDHGIAEQNASVLAWSVLGLLALTLLKGGFTFFQGWWAEIASQSVVYDVRNAIQNKLTPLSFSYHDRSETGADYRPSRAERLRQIYDYQPAAPPDRISAPRPVFVPRHDCRQYPLWTI
jgi:ABC-type multidrug transport system fused ATPase/permease subunit